MFLTILQIIWQLGIIIWFAYSTVYTLRNLLAKLNEKRKE